MNTPIPLGEVKFEEILKGHTQIKESYLILLTKRRKEVTEKYVEALYFLCKFIENSCDPLIKEPILANFKWMACDGKTYSSTCIKFELIMAALCIGIKNLNELKTRESFKYIRGICKEEIMNWTTRKEKELPLESTEIGIEIYCSIVKISFQKQLIEKKEEHTPWSLPSIPYGLFRWMYEETIELYNQIELRIEDGSGIYFQDTSFFPKQIQECRTEYFCSLLYYGAMMIEENEKIDESKQKAFYLIGIAESQLKDIKVKVELDVDIFETEQKEKKKEDEEETPLMLIKKKIQNKKKDMEVYFEATFETKTIKNNTNIWKILPDEKPRFFSKEKIKFVIPKERSILLEKSIRKE